MNSISNFYTTEDAKKKAIKEVVCPCFYYFENQLEKHAASWNVIQQAGKMCPWNLTEMKLKECYDYFYAIGKALIITFSAYSIEQINKDTLEDLKKEIPKLVELAQGISL